jgi:tetratricopeptide (TPR) repeat protein
MSTTTDFDESRAHQFFSANCFNRTWELIEEPNRSDVENEQMLLFAHASLWHWTMREDCTERNRSTGYWQLARVYAVLGQAENAMRYGELCLQLCQSESAFYLGYAHEAVARAAMLAGDRELAIAHVNEARKLAAQVDEADERTALEKDLGTIV